MIAMPCRTSHRRAAPPIRSTPASAQAGTTTSTAPAVLPSCRQDAHRACRDTALAGGRGNARQLWPQIKEFWQETGFIVDLELPEAGVMETDWAENRAKLPQDIIRSTIGKVFDSLYSTAERDKFRTRLEKGAEPGTTEIYISHRGMYEIYINEGKSQTRWQPRPAEPELEAEMLRRLMVRLGADETRAKSAGCQREAVGARQADPRSRRRRHADDSGILRSRLAARRTGARPRRLHRRGSRPLAGHVFRPLYRSRSQRQEEGRQGLARQADILEE